MSMNAVNTANSANTRRTLDLLHMPDAGIARDRSQDATRVTARELVKLLRFDCENDPALDSLVFTTRRVSAGEVLYRAGDACQSFYVVRSGVLKTVAINEEGAEQVLSFRIKGDPVGMDGVGSGRHASEAIALENVEVIIVPIAVLSRSARACPVLDGLAYRALSRELVREQALIYVIASLRAEARVAAFLVNLADRYGALGYSRTSFVLRMTRQEIGSCLGLQLETVSRTFSAFAAARLIVVDLKNIEILDLAALRRIVTDSPSARTMGADGPRASTAARPRSTGLSGRVLAFAA